MFRSNKNVTLKSWYGELEAERSPYLDRAEQASDLTLPWWIRRDKNDGKTYTTPYQSVGAEGVTNLASRLNMVLMPPNRPMFRLKIARAIIEEATGDKRKEAMLTEINNALSRTEIEATGLIEGMGDRTSLYSAMIHLLIAGNVLLHVPSDNAMRVFSLRNYVVERDYFGNPITIIVKETVSFEALPDNIKKVLKNKNKLNVDERQPYDIKQYEIYTCIHWENEKWHVWQECEDIPVGKEGYYRKDECPWIALRLYRCEEESYGRGYVEQFHGSLYSVNILSRAMLEACGAAAKVIFLVHPSAVTKPNELAKADNLSFVLGKKDDIDILQLEKYHDLQTATTQIQQLTRSLSKVFLLNSSVQRDGERVTAEEIRYMAQELETALGGLYSVLAKEFQKPYITLRLKYFQEKGQIPRFTDGVKPEVITGVDALGRGQDANTLVQFGSTIFKSLPPEAIMQYMNVHGYLKSLAAAYGIDDTTILKTEEQIGMERQQAQQQQMLQGALPNVINAGGRLADTAMKNNMENQQGVKPNA